MNRIISIILIALLAAPATVLAQSSPGPSSAYLNPVASLVAALVQTALRLPVASSVDDFVNAFIAQISVSGAAQSVVYAAIDGAIATPGLPKAAIQALNILRRKISHHRDYTGGLDGPDISGPGGGPGGGSDYAH